MNSVCKLLKTLVKLEPEIKDQRACWKPEFLKKQSPYTVIKHNPYKFLKQVYKKLNWKEKRQFKEAIIGKMQVLAIKQLEKKENGN